MVPHAVFTSFILSAAQDVNLVRTEPDPQQLPCPHQRIEFQCQTLVPSSALTWTLPTGVELEFGVLRNVGDVRNSSDNVYSATLTEKIEDDDTNTDRFFFTSTLLLLQPVNRSTLTCEGDDTNFETTVTLSGIVVYVHCAPIDIHLIGPPDPPSDLDYNDGVVIESSVDLQWTRPSYTGGVDVMNYTVSANGRRLEVMDDSETVSYTTSGLVYGEVQVSAINTCGQKSQPATINIPAQGM